MFKNTNKYFKEINQGKVIKIKLRPSKANSTASIFFEFTDFNGQRRKIAQKFTLCKDLKKPASDTNIQMAIMLRDKKEIQFREEGVSFSLVEKHKKDFNLYAEMEAWVSKYYTKSQTRKNALNSIRALEKIWGCKCKTKNQIKREDAINLKDSFLKHFNTHNTARANFKNIKSFFSNQYKMGKISNNPFSNVSISEKELPIVCLTKDEFASFSSTKIDQLKLWIDATPKDYFKDSKTHSYLKNLSYNDFEETLNAFIFSAMTGLRPSDVENLKGNQFEEYSTTISAKKTENVQVININKSLAPIFNKQMQKHGKDNFLFSLPRSCDRSRILKAIGSFHKINKNIEFRMARRTFCGLAINHSAMDIYTISKAMGHSSISITQRYYASLDIAKTKENMDTLPKFEF